MSVLIHNAMLCDSRRAPRRGWLLADGALIAALGEGDVPAEVADRATEKTDARGALLMPGAIDCHVHFREPGMEQKADIAGESRAAIVGGVTSYIEMPNTKPATTTVAAWEDKMERAAARSAANYAFMMGATADNLAELRAADARLMPAVKVFMGSSTGGMLLCDERPLTAVFAEQGARVVVHAEDQGIIDANAAALPADADLTDMRLHTAVRSAEACVRATERALELAVRYGTRLHVAHVTTAMECRLFDPAPTPAGKQYTAEVSPHHLLWTVDDYARLGSRIKMNPAVKTAADRAALRAGLADGRLDIVATDHAPHLPADKQGDIFHAASGAPMVQFSLPVMLDLYDPQTVSLRMSAAPAALYGIERRGLLEPGYYADLVLVEHLDEAHVITDSEVVSKCGWTPMAGYGTRHRVAAAWVNGGLGPRALRFGYSSKRE